MASAASCRGPWLPNRSLVKPVSRFQWFFNFTHKIVSLIDGVTTRQVPRTAVANVRTVTVSKV